MQRSFKRIPIAIVVGLVCLYLPSRIIELANQILYGFARLQSPGFVAMARPKPASTYSDPIVHQTDLMWALVIFIVGLVIVATLYDVVEVYVNSEATLTREDMYRLGAWWSIVALVLQIMSVAVS